MRPIVLKFGGELLEDHARLNGVVRAVARIAAMRVPLAIIHGGGREIDAALNAAGIAKRQVDGLRVTDAATLDVVVAVLGAINTRFVAALGAAGVDAVGLTGADGGCGLSDVAPLHRTVDGREVDLGRVGVPARGASVRVLQSLMRDGFVPVVACIGTTADGRLLNVNADTLAGHLAARLGARRLAIAGTTAGVLNVRGATASTLEPADIARLVSDGTATAGMIAKLRACEHALANGVDEIVIVDGRDGAALEAVARGDDVPSATRIGADSTTKTI